MNLSTGAANRLFRHLRWLPEPVYYWLLDRLTDNNGWRPLFYRCSERAEPNRPHFLIGNDRSRRWRLIVTRWYIEVTVRGYYVNVGWL